MSDADTHPEEGDTTAADAPPPGEVGTGDPVEESTTDKTGRAD